MFKKYTIFYFSGTWQTLLKNYHIVGSAVLKVQQRTRHKIFILANIDTKQIILNTIVSINRKYSCVKKVCKEFKVFEDLRKLPRILCLKKS